MASEALQQAQAEGLTLLRQRVLADDTTGYFGVSLNQPGHQPKPYQARVQRGGKRLRLGHFATAEEAALCVARSPEGQAVAGGRAAAAAPLTSEEARQQAQAEGLTLRVAETKTGYSCVAHCAGQPKPYQAQVKRGGSNVHLGSFVTAEEAALCVARSPEGRAAAKRAAAAVPLTSEEARQQAQAEKLTLLAAKNKTGYFGVRLTKPGQPKPYQARVQRGGNTVSLGSFATAEEAALCVARSPEGQAEVVAERSTAAATLTSEEARQQAQAEGLTLRVSESKAGYFGAAAAESQGTLPAAPSGAIPQEKAMAPGAVVKVEDLLQLLDDDLEAALPSGPIEEGTAPPLPPGTFVMEEVVVKEEEGSDCLPKRQRMK
eukprot:scaffold65928_cov46-Phaeocystis_antarctica.AAC.1